MIVSETIREAETVASTASGSVRTKSPDDSGMKHNGRNAKISTPVDPTTATAISRVPSIAACVASSPSRILRPMLSVTTIESSTSNPSDMTNPDMLSWLRLWPSCESTNTPIASDKGIDTTTPSSWYTPISFSPTTPSVTAFTSLAVVGNS